MNTDKNTVRLLGAAQVIYSVGFLITGGFLLAAVGSGSISDRYPCECFKKPHPDADQQSGCTGSKPSNRCPGCFVLYRL
jgi:hypothetical protein